MQPIHYILGWMGACVILGAVWYLLDRRLGARLYRLGYAWTHEHPLPPGEERGFLFQQKARVRFAWAVVFSALQSGLIVTQGHVNPLIEMLTFFFEVPALMGGFFLGPFLDRLWTRKDRVLDKIDELESGDTSIKELANDAMDRAGIPVNKIPVYKTLARDPVPLPDVRPEPDPEPVTPSIDSLVPPPPAATPSPELSPEEAHRAALRRFSGEKDPQ